MKATRPLVSVLLPARDAERTVGGAIESLQAQTLREIEIMAVDDGSRDGTPEVIARMARRDRRIALLRQEPRGIVAALKRAIAAARAPLLARMDADDLSHPERLRRQVAWLERRPDLVGVGSLVASFREGSPVLPDGWRRYERWLNRRHTAADIARDLLVESPLPHPSMLLRRDALESVGGYRDFDGPEDYDLWLRLALAGGRFAKVPAVLLRWRDYTSRLTRTDARYRLDAFLQLKVDYLRRGPLRARHDRPLLVWGAGRYGGRFGRWLQRAGVTIDAFIDISPRRIGKSKRDCPVIAPRELDRFAHPMVLGAVPIPEARPVIRRRLTRHGLREGTDYWLCG